MRRERLSVQVSPFRFEGNSLDFQRDVFFQGIVFFFKGNATLWMLQKSKFSPLSLRDVRTIGRISERTVFE